MKKNQNNTASALQQGEHFADVNGISIHYYVRGSGPVLLFPSPGWGPSVDYVMPMPCLEKYCKVVYFDTRHSGQSTGPENPEEYKLEYFVADIEALRIHLQQPKIFLAGHSGGGHQVLAYAAAYHRHVLGVVAIDAIAAADSIRAEEMMRRIAKKKHEPFYTAHPDYYDRATAVMLNTQKASLSVKEIIGAMGAFYFYEPSLASSVFANMEYNDDVFRFTQSSGFQGKNLLPELHQITAPVLIVVGEDDFICDPVTQGERMYEKIRFSTLEVIQQAGHMPWLEQPELFYNVCEAWFNAISNQYSAPAANEPYGK